MGVILAERDAPGKVWYAASVVWSTPAPPSNPIPEENPMALSAPLPTNTVRVEGTVSNVYLGANNFGAFTLALLGSTETIRLESDNKATQTGLDRLTAGDRVIAYGKLDGYPSTRFDGVDTQVFVLQIYRYTPETGAYELL
jgi:hypothetical protein